VGLSASVPLFEYGRTKQQAAGPESPGRLKPPPARRGLPTSFCATGTKRRTNLRPCATKRRSTANQLEETAEIARLRYSSYRDGGSTILDVETADVNSVLARVTAARTRTQALIQLATLR